MYNPFKPEKPAAAPAGPLTLATVGTVSEEGVTLILPGASEPTQAHYPNFSSSSLESGDSVIISRVSGTWVVMGKAGGGSGGGGGGTSNYNDLSNKPSINGNTLRGNKTASELGLGTYSKPSGGIPKSDLTSAVQTSLGKADSALQSVPSTYRTAAEQDAVDEAARSQTIKNIEGTASGSITAGTNSSVTVDIPVPTGYRIFAINTIGFSGTNSDYLALRGYVAYSSRNQVKINIRSMATQSTINYSVDVWVTCAKTDLF